MPRPRPATRPKSATHEDAMLYLQLHRDFPSESARWVQANVTAKSYEDFEKDYPRSSPNRLQVTKVLGFFEMVGTLAYYGALNEDLFFDSGFNFQFIWEKLEPIVLGWQKVANDPFAWDTTVWFAEKMKAWRKEHSKPKASTAKPT